MKEKLIDLSKPTEKEFIMSSIKIVSIPPGNENEPEWVRKEWVGVVIPLPKQRSSDTSKETLGGDVEKVNVYQVEMTKAMETLLKKSVDAARWWRQNVSLGVEHLSFPEDVCELIP